MSENANHNGENTDRNPATHLGRTMKRDRTAHGWSLRDMYAKTKVHIGTLSQVENGKRPMTEKLAIRCDELFPERRGWYLSYYEESKSWVPAGFRNWAEYEDKAAILRSWTPSVLDGLVQTEDYARELLGTSLGATPDVIAARLASRMQRQQRVLYRDEPPMIMFVVDEPSLYRLVGSPEIMAAQMRHLRSVARLPHVTLQVLPAVAHPAGASGFVATDSAAYAEHTFGGYVFTDIETVTAALRLFSSIAAECYRASESAAMIERLGEEWKTGVPRPTATRTAASA